MPQVQLDTRALEKATRVETMIEMHQLECDRRQADIIRRFESGSDKMDLLSGEVTSLQTSLGTALLGIETKIGELKTSQLASLNKHLLAFTSMLVLALGYFLMTFGLPGNNNHQQSSSSTTTTFSSKP